MSIETVITETAFVPLEAKDTGADRKRSGRVKNAAGYDSGHRDALGAYLRQIAARPLLSRGEEKRLARRARAGSKRARDELVSRNLRLVVPTAKKYRGQGLSLEDLIQEGNDGLLVAVDRFDPEAGNRFSTYATRWVHQRIAYAVATHGRAIRLPEEVGRARRRAYHAAQQLAAELGREPTPEEIRIHSGLGEKEFERAWSAPERRASLDAPVRSSEPDGTELGSFIADTAQSEEVVGEALSLLGRLEVRRVLGDLRVRQRYVIERLYGLDGGGGLTRRELAKEMGISASRVSMIDHEAREKLEPALRAHGIYDSRLREAS